MPVGGRATAGWGGSAGLALRFARVLRYRPDEAAAEADTVATVRALHPAQD